MLCKHPLRSKVDNYRFWLHEYLVRNSNCLENYSNILRCIDNLCKNDVPGLLFILAGEDIFNDICKIKEEKASDTVAIELIKKTEELVLRFSLKYGIMPFLPYLTPDPRDSFASLWDSSAILSEVEQGTVPGRKFIDRYTYKSVSQVETKSDNNILVNIDLSAGSDVILAELEMLIAGHKKREPKVEEDILAWQKPLEKIYKSCSKLLINNGHASRATGLWLWDYILDNYGGGTPPRGAITKAVNELKARFNLSKIGYADSNQKVLEDKYRGTCKCIEACEVLPF